MEDDPWAMGLRTHRFDQDGVANDDYGDSDGIFGDRAHGPSGASRSSTDKGPSLLLSSNAPSYQSVNTGQSNMFENAKSAASPVYGAAFPKLTVSPPGVVPASPRTGSLLGSPKANILIPTSPKASVPKARSSAMVKSTTPKNRSSSIANAKKSSSVMKSATAMKSAPSMKSAKNKTYVTLKPLPEVKLATSLAKKAATAAENAKVSSDGRRYWTDEEDEIIRQYLPLYGKKWQRIANHIPSRTGRQVRERVVDSLMFQDLLAALETHGQLMVEDGEELQAVEDWTQTIELHERKPRPWTLEEDNKIRAIISKSKGRPVWTHMVKDFPGRNRASLRFRALFLAGQIKPMKRPPMGKASSSNAGSSSSKPTLRASSKPNSRASSSKPAQAASSFGTARSSARSSGTSTNRVSRTSITTGRSSKKLKAIGDIRESGRSSGVRKSR